MTFVAEVNGHNTNGRKRAGGAAAATQQLVAQHAQRSLDRVRALEIGRSQEQARAASGASRLVAQHAQRSVASATAPRPGPTPPGGFPSPGAWTFLMLRHPRILRGTPKCAHADQSGRLKVKHTGHHLG